MEYISMLQYFNNDTSQNSLSASSFTLLLGLLESCLIHCGYFLGFLLVSILGSLLVGSLLRHRPYVSLAHHVVPLCLHITRHL